MAYLYPSALETEIYVSEAGNICIKQSNYPEDDILVVLNIHQAEWLYQNLSDLIVDAKDFGEGSNEIDS